MHLHSDPQRNSCTSMENSHYYWSIWVSSYSVWEQQQGMSAAVVDHPRYSYIIAIRDIFEDIIDLDVLPDWLANKYLLTSVFWFCIMLPLSSLRSIDNLRFSSFFGILSVIYLVVSVIILCCSHFEKESFQSLSMFNWNLDLMRAIPIMLFAYSCQCNVYEIQTDLGEDNAKSMQ